MIKTRRLLDTDYTYVNENDLERFVALVEGEYVDAPELGSSWENDSGTLVVRGILPGTVTDETTLDLMWLIAKMQPQEYDYEYDPQDNNYVVFRLWWD